MTNSRTITNSTKPRCVVGIGASAGGLEALQQLLTYLPSDTGMAFVIIQHLSPDHKSLLADILGKYTAMPVVEVDDGMPIEGDHIYMIPPKFNLEIEEDVLRLREFDHAKINHPIDIFFRSLANAYESRAVAVILSGTGSDGTNGIKAIREQNGVIIVQSPESCKFDGMPRNAIATGFEDMVLHPDSIAREMAHIAESMGDSENGLQMTDEDLLSQIFSVLKAVTNVNYTFYKQTTILRRIERRMVVTHNRNFSEYVKYLRNNQEEARMLAKEVLIGVTSFFRDPDYFEVLKSNVITHIVRNTPNGEQIRVWVAGCSTGEEAYTIAILFAEVMEELKIRRDIKIFATDLDSDSIAFAGRGVYNDTIIDDISVGRLARFFTRKGNKYIINHDIRRMIVFAQHNVFQDPPFGRLDLISCRNLLIYFQNVLQKNLFAIFHIALKDRGYLFLGRSESVGDYNDIFRVYCASEKIFAHNASGREPSHTKLSYSVQSFTPGLDTTPSETSKNENYDLKYTSGELDTKVLEKLLPATVMIDVQNLLNHTYGDCRDFINIPVGSITLDIFSLIRSDLKIAVSKALKEVRGTDKPVSYDRIPINTDGGQEFITLAASPITDKLGEKTGIIALSFIRGGTPQGVIDSSEHFKIDSAAAERISDLEKELRQSQDNLKHTVTELESVNAELQAANEELMTANEELQSSNEELQSVNEELYTVNSEYQAKVTELGNVNDDMTNFLSTTLVGIMMVDNQLNIRKYTEYIADEFNVAEQDVGRSLRYIAFNFSSIDLMGLSLQVQKSRKAVELTCVSDEGKSYLIRIAPYRSDKYRLQIPVENLQDKYSAEELKNIEGLVLTFVDTTKQIDVNRQITEMRKTLKVTAESNKEKEKFLEHISDDLLAPITEMQEALHECVSDEKLDEDLKSRLDKICVSEAKLRSMIEEIGEANKINSGKAVLNPSAVREISPFRKAAEEIKAVADAANITLESDIIGSENRVIMMDDDSMQLILAGLFANAIRFTAEGGHVKACLKVSYPERGKTKHVYTITDDGCGIREEFRKVMYKPYEQDPECETLIGEAAGEGTGLGLFIVRSLVQLMGGTIECSSRVGEGTEFRLTFDFSLATEEQKKLRFKPGANFLTNVIYGRNVLIAEDNREVAGMLRQVLEENGVHSEITADGKEACEMFRKNGAYHYTAILVDVRVPVLDGVHMSRTVRTLGTADAKSIPIIGITADYSNSVSEACMNAGMNRIVRKNADAEEIIGILAEAIYESERNLSEE
ncbi:MAG: chemotaxis protein CheB [Eubacterium sp.]|nr:chemotaxis protein CheB [Eubacterium sp.]